MASLIPHRLSQALGALWAAVLLPLCSCSDDLPYDHGDPVAGLRFSVSMESSWLKGVPNTRGADTEISIDELPASDEGGSLFLVTEREDIGAIHLPAGQVEATRGKVVTDESFPSSFGVSAICYNGTAEASADQLAPFGANLASDIRVSKAATVWVPEAGTRLDWPGSGRVRFLAYAPYSEDCPEAVYSTPDGVPTLRFTPSKTVTGQTDLLTASKDVAGSGGADVDLTFRHALTAVRVRLGDAFLAGDITEVSLSGIYGSGSLNLLTNVWTPVGEATTSFTAAATVSTEYKDKNTDGQNPYGNPTDIVEDSEGTLMTFFMIPHEQLPASATLSIKFKDKLSQTERTVSSPIGGEGKSWTPGSIYTYSLSSTGVVADPVVVVKRRLSGSEKDFDIESWPFSGILHDTRLQAYVRVTQAGEETKNVAVPFDIYYAASDPSAQAGGWTPAEGDWKKAKWIPDNDADRLLSEGSTKPSPGTLALPDAAQSVFKSSHDKFNGKKFNESPCDLSLERGSANCYMISSPGNYTFPTVYGNSLNADGTVNKASFDFDAAGRGDHEPGMNHFVDHRDNKIEYSRISAQPVSLKDAFLLWDDSPGLVDRVILSEDKGSVSFRVSDLSIAQGNAVIAVRNNDNDIVWSWHIWVREETWYEREDEHIETKTKDSSGNEHTFTFPPTTLGYCDAHGGNDPRRVMLKFEFSLKDADGAKRVCYVELPQDGVTASNAGDNTYYQWGRKDPMLPGVYDKNDYQYWGGGLDNEFTMLNKAFFDYLPEYAFTRSKDADGNPIGNGYTLGEAIRHPHHFVRGTAGGATDYRKHWYRPGTGGVLESGEASSMYNAWNSAASSDGIVNSKDPANFQKVVKTIYDPCPPGYHMPCAGAFTNMLDYQGEYYCHGAYPDNPVTWDAQNRCWHLKSNSDGFGSDVCLYATGMRDMTEANGKAPLDNDEYTKMTWPAYSMITYICSGTLYYISSQNAHQALLFYLDDRPKNIEESRDKMTGDNKAVTACGSCRGTNNSYGFTVWPVADD